MKKNYTQTHREIFRNIHNFLAGRVVGATRERALLNEVIKCLFCKLYLLRNGEETVKEDDYLLAETYRKTFGILKKQIPDVFDEQEEIMLDPASIHYFDTEISKIDLLKANRDPFGDLYEIFIGTGVREEEGQFFTPKNGVDLLVSIVDPKPEETIIDPACGAGGFLTSTIKHWNGDSQSFKTNTGGLFGIDKDSYLSDLAKIHVALLTFSTGHTLCGNSLSWTDKEEKPIDASQGGYDVVLTNPPFGKKIVAVSKEVQATYDLGYKWKLDRKSGRYEKTDKLQKSVPPQVLFVEKCIKLLKEGGRLGIVLPESLLTSKTYSYVVQYMSDTCRILSVMGMPENFFKTSGKGGTHTKACLVVMKKEKAKIKGNTIFMAEAKWCGNDSRGKEIEFDDLPLILDNFQDFKGGKLKPSPLGYPISQDELKEFILSPRYYNPEILTLMNSFKDSHDIVSVQKLLDDGIIEVKTGDEVGKMAYGTGDIPFVRTSDISSWEVKLDPKHGMSREIYEKYRSKQDVRPNDILMVKDGTYLIGTCAILTKYDTEIVYQSHLFKIRVLKPEILSPFLLLALLSSQPVKDQIKSKRFTQDIIDSLGARLYEILLPIPKAKSRRDIISETVETVIKDRIHARELARKACLDVLEV